jgi:hypothetical protein
MALPLQGRRKRGSAPCSPRATRARNPARHVITALAQRSATLTRFSIPFPVADPILALVLLPG